MMRTEELREIAHTVGADSRRGSTLDYETQSSDDLDVRKKAADHGQTNETVNELITVRLMKSKTDRQRNNQSSQMKDMAMKHLLCRQTEKRVSDVSEFHDESAAQHDALSQSHQTPKKGKRLLRFFFTEKKNLTRRRQQKHYITTTKQS
ncbi:hypothetical protein KIN20_032597 [Parelaphostrongylus tenuis]|uniref:Uncharacterized protein n=1 Tax=Parelaphostrongylus tenuis TaxID=148309 RepID=A0AAD5R728_PARTN|nr:hypothetical protein KIN20_032597 [Parelaphostrongylus tenuis]